jgi:transcriptional regulator with XRE-family HTH domain
MTHWSDLIRRYRRANGLTQAAFAECVGVEQATVSRWERGFHAPDLTMQGRLRTLLFRRAVVSDAMVMHRVRGSLGAAKLADRNGWNRAASPRAAALHGVEFSYLQSFDYTPLHTEELRAQWDAVRALGFFAGNVASVRVFNTWRPAALPDAGDGLRHCEGFWTPVVLSDGEIMLISEFHEIDEQAYRAVSPGDRLRAVMAEEVV